MTQKQKGIFIAGTGTNVGKSVVTAALSRALYMVGHAGHIPIKPVQTGVSNPQDADVALYTAAHVGLNSNKTIPAGQTLYSFTLPASPHLAAAQQWGAEQELDAQDIVAQVQDFLSEMPVLLEGAGGLFVPLNAHETFLDVICALHFPVVLVVQNTLGALNTTLLSLEALRQRNISVLALICVDTDGKGAEELLVRADNVLYLREHAPELLVLEMPYIQDLQKNSAILWDKAAESLLPLATEIRRLWEMPSTPAFQASHDTVAWDKAHLWHPYTSIVEPLPVYEVSHTEGMYIHLRNGKALIDGMASWWCAIHGYGQADLVRACQHQVQRMAHVMFGGLTHVPAVQAGQKLLALVPTALQHVFWADSGSVAVEVALKMALQYQQGKGQKQRIKILSPRGGYYGDTLGAMSVCDPINGMHGLFSHVLPQHIFIQRPACPFNGQDDCPFDSASLQPLEEAFAVHGESMAACILEPIVQGAGGMYFYHPRYVQRARQLCNEYGVLFICDEIATGFGRSGKLFACEWAQITPDILCLGKALTGGMMTLAAALCTQKVAQGICAEGQVFMHGPTFMANPLACAVASAALDVFVQSPWQVRVARIAEELQEGLAPCKACAAVKNVRVLGAIGVVEMKVPVNTAKLQAFFVEQGVWIRPFAKLIYVMPPYIASTQEIKTLCNAIVASIVQGEYC